MKRFLLLAALAGGAYLAYRSAVVEAPVRAYGRFAEAWAKEDTPAAVALTDGEEARKAVESKILRGVLRAPMEAYRGMRKEIESRETLPGGEVSLTARVFVRFDPPGITSGLGGAMEGSFRHVVRMKKTDAGWRVVAFEPEFLEAVSTRRPM